MFEHFLTVKYLTSKTCFCYLSPKNLKTLKGTSVKLSNNGEIHYFSVNPSGAHLDDESVGIGSLYARTLGLEDNQTVSLTQIIKPPTISSMEVTAVNKEDHEVLELLAENVQSTLLNQIRVLKNGQRFVIFVGQGINVTVQVSQIKPISPGYIENFTEVIIKPPNSTNLVKVPETDNLPKSQTFVSLFNYFESKLNSIENDLSLLENYLKCQKDLVLRLVPFDNVIRDNFSHPFNVFVFRSNFNLGYCENTLTTPVICSLTLLNSLETKTVYVRLCILEDFISSNLLTTDSNSFISGSVFDYFGCQVGARAVLKPYYSSLCPEIEEIQVYTTNKNKIQNLKEYFKQYLIDKCDKGNCFLLNSDILIDIGRNVKCLVKFQPCQVKFCVVHEIIIKNLKFVVEENNFLPEDNEKEKNNKFLSSEIVLNISNYEEIVTKSLNNFLVNENNSFGFENVLIIGKPGTGKTTLLKVINERLSHFPNYIYVKIINCKNIKGKTVDSLHKFLITIFYELIHHQPSVLLIDDLHILCENVNETDALAQNAIYFNRLSEMLQNIFDKFCKTNKIGILATTETITKLNKNIYMSRGSHLFKNLFQITDLEKNDRKLLLEFLFATYELCDVNLDLLAQKLESFVIQDVVDFVEKAVFESYKDENAEEELKITNENCEKALKNTSILSLHDIHLHSSGHKDFSDIGGLNDVKTILIETMLWPIQYPNLFAKAPLRLQSGLLLYGPPGTGKTLLAGAAAKHCRLRLISIKGPELLSKYIGASEQAVRDIFEKAQSAKPCILFFDEFDSLAPRRGHDNTGVTDRVVNQLLTQLDGVESLSGVCVLAATSRPDLLDPALLRPGRLDKQILCSLPDQNTRLEILKVLSKSMLLSVDVNLNKLAQNSEGFSGADLQSVLYTAQLASVEHLLLDKKEFSEEIISEITQTQLENALSKTRPSLTREEKLKYEKIYYKFQGGIMDDFKAGSKATLA